MKQLMVIALLLLPELAAARVYMCVDPITGQTLFTDKACASDSSREEVRVDPANLDSGRRYAQPARQKTWRSEADTRKTGLDYNADRRSAYESKAAISAR